MRSLVLLSAMLAAQALAAEPSAAQHPTDVDPSYRLGSGDLVSIHVYGEELDSSQQLDSTGKLRLPLLDEVRLSGQTLREAEKYLEQLYRQRELLRNPMVSVTLVSVAVREASVLGAVRQPGDLQFPNQATSMSIVDVITRTGGFLPIARADAVKVTRHGPDGNEVTVTIDVEGMLSGRRGGSTGKDFQVLPGDHIWVPERLF